MIPVSMLLGAIVVFTIAAITIWLHPTKLAKGVMSSAVIVAVIALVLIIAFSAGAKSDIEGLTARYNDLMLYYNTVVYSDNEYVRYDYYDKVNVYNDWYERTIKSSESKWSGWFYSDEDLARIHPINFTLHGDNFYGEG